MQQIKKLPKKVFFMGGVLLLILTAIIAAMIITRPTITLPGAKPTPPQTPKAITNLLKSVGEKTQLPEEEIPTVATVSDPKKLSDQAFFANAQQGDKVLMFIQSQRAYLYRPSTDAIIQASKLEILDKNASESAEQNASDAAVLRVRF